MTLSVVPFPITPLDDIPAKLRQLADEIEKGEYSDVSSVALVLENEEDILTFGFGGADTVRAFWLYHQAADSLMGPRE